MSDEFEFDVYLAYASVDKPAVRELAQQLKGDGLRVWLDEWVIQPGDMIPLKIEQGLESSRTLILVMSKAAFASEWVTLERHTALFRDPTNQQRRFIPLRLDDCDIKDSLKQFAHVDWRKSDERQYQRMLTRLRRVPWRPPAATDKSASAEADLVFAIGKLGYTFPSLRRRESFLVRSEAKTDADLVEYLRSEPTEAEAIAWTLSVDDKPAYIIQPSGAFAAIAYGRLCEFLSDLEKGDVERISIGGEITGQSSIETGETLPVVRPALEVMYSWTTKAIVERSISTDSADPMAEYKAVVLERYLERIYAELRLGRTPADRAVNYSAANARQISTALDRLVDVGFDLSHTELKSFEVQPSKNKALHTCWEMIFAFHSSSDDRRRICRCFVDVNDVLPVFVHDIDVYEDTVRNPPVNPRCPQGLALLP